MFDCRIQKASEGIFKCKNHDCFKNAGVTLTSLEFRPNRHKLNHFLGRAIAVNVERTPIVNRDNDVLKSD